MVTTWQVAHLGPHPLLPQGVLSPPHFLSDTFAGYAPTSSPELAKQLHPGDIQPVPMPLTRLGKYGLA